METIVHPYASFVREKDSNITIKHKTDESLDYEESLANNVHTELDLFVQIKTELEERLQIDGPDSGCGEDVGFNVESPNDAHRETGAHKLKHPATFERNLFPASIVDSVTEGKRSNQHVMPMDVCHNDVEDSNSSTITSQNHCIEKVLEQLQLCPSSNRLKSAKKKEPYIIRKELRQSGHAYISPKGKFVNAKTFKMYLCHEKCPHRCTKKLSEIDRKAIFKEFWDMRDLTLQNNFLANSVEIRKTQRTTVANSRKQNSRKFFLNNIQVCKSVFLYTLNISNRRIHYCINVKQKDRSCSPDRRGKSSINRISEKKVEDINKFLNSIPRYKDNYTTNDKYYFSPELTKKFLYILYKEKHPTNPVTLDYFYRILNKYEVETYLKINNCQQCDTIPNSEDPTELHLKHAEVAIGIQNAAKGIEKRKKGTLAFSFDMQKMQPLPRLQTSVIYHKQQLIISTLGINDLSDNQGTMCIWTENEGLRGSPEIISAIFAYLKSQNLKDIHKIETFSSACRGHNKNKTIVSFFSWFCKKYKIDEWTHTYMESGHSYLPNYKDFGIIEKKSKSAFTIYSKEDWFNLVAKSQKRKPFHIIDMKGKFIDCEKFTNQRKFDCGATSDSVKFDFLNLKAFTVKKDSSVVIYRRSGDKFDVPSHVLEFPNIDAVEELSYLPENSIRISAEKYKDLQGLLQYIPPQNHEFYKSLKT